MKVHNFKELKVWQQAMDVTVQAYVLTSSFPKEEKFGLVSQIQRSAVSILQILWKVEEEFQVKNCNILFQLQWVQATS